MATGIALLLLGLNLGVGYSWMPQFSALAMAIATLVSYLTGIGAYALVYSGLSKDTQQFLGFLVTAMLGKMLIGILTIVVVAVKYKAVRDEYIVVFFISYFIFTAFEVFSLMRKLRPKF